MLFPPDKELKVFVVMLNRSSWTLPKGNRMCLDSELLEHENAYDAAIFVKRGLFVVATEDIKPKHYGLFEIEL